MRPEREGGWFAGRIYFRPKDPRVIVKRHAGSYTMNFGNKWTWVISAVVVGALAIVLMIAE